MDQDHQERIRQRAHEIWESEGRPEGRDADHWSQAEQELHSQTGEGDQTGSRDQSSGAQAGSGQGGEPSSEMTSDTIQSPDSVRTASQDKPKPARRTSEKKPAAERKPRKSAKSASATSTPYLNDGP